jgi:uncharacterized membrane protein
MSVMRKPSLTERLRAKKNALPMTVGVAWYTEEDWREMKAAATDPERFEESHAEWIAMAIEAVADLRKAGVNTVKVFVITAELLPWCLVRGKPNNAASRAEFVAEKMRSQSEGGA